MKCIERIVIPANKYHRTEHKVLVFKARSIDPHGGSVIGVRRSYWPDDKETMWFSTQQAAHKALTQGVLPL